MLSSIIRRTDSLANVKFSTTTNNNNNNNNNSIATSMITTVEEKASSSLSSRRRRRQRQQQQQKRSRSRPSFAAPLACYKLNGICTNFTMNRNLLIAGLIFIIVICNGKYFTLPSRCFLSVYEIA
uniref:Uncharacterized protein n=1 Tax=Glossina brevipalpis TaxID=37001 RepID=A0A1A9WNQ0_9MUSC